MSEETKNPLIESFLKLHEAPIWGQRNATTTTNAQAGSEYAQRMNNAFNKPNPTAGSENMNFSGGGPAGSALPNPTLGSANMRFSGGGPTGTGPVKTGSPIAAGGGTIRPAIDAAPRPQPNMTLQRQQSGDVAPKIDNSASINKAKNDFQTRVGGVERQNPISAPGKLQGGNLQMGSRGDSVKELQRKLGIKDDGIFGKDTAAALKSFQQKNNLKVDSVYGKQSASAMNRTSDMNALKKETPVGAAMSARSTTPSSPMAGQTTSGSTQSKIIPDRTSINLRNNNRDRMESTEMSNKLIDSFLKLQSIKTSNIFEAAKKAKKLDPVGKEDEDIDNDGDKDKSDSYLHNRRKKIAAAMKEAIDPNAEGIAKDKEKAPVMVPKPDYPTSKPGPTRELKGSLPKGVTVKGNTNEEVEQIDEALSAEHKAAIKAHVKGMWGRGEVAFGSQGGKDFVSHSDGIQKHVHSIHYKKGVPHVTHFLSMDEEVEFSEAELTHFASILEGPVAPQDDTNTAFGTSGSRTGTVSEEEKKAYSGAKRGRKAGVKVGAYGPRGSKKGDNNEGQATTNVAHPHPFHQIRASRPDSEGNYTVTREEGGKVQTAKVPAKAAAQYHASYLAAGKPAIKDALTSDFVGKHFPGSQSKSSGGISLPKMPAPKS